MVEEKSSVRRLQLLLHEACRTEQDRSEARHAAEILGLSLTGEGRASLSVRLADDQFVKLFGVATGKAAELTVPDPLKPYVASISEAPQHLFFD